MNSKQRRKKRRADTRRRKIRIQEELLKDLSEEIDDEEDEEDFEKEIQEPMDIEEPEQVEKTIAVVPITPSPKSWEEAEVAEDSRAKAQKLQKLSYTAEDLVSNIIYDPLLNPEEKADGIKAVGMGYANRVQVIMDSPSEVSKEFSDVDLLALEAVIAQDKRSSSLIDKFDMFRKRKLSGEAREALKDSDFALVKTVDGKKIRKYPIHDKAHVRNALARAAQQIKGGGEAASDAKAALPKIRAAAKRMGIEVSMGKERNSFVIEKDMKGQWRMVGWASNNYIDRDGEIISKAAHEEYVSWLDEHPNMMPAFLVWHTPGTMRKNRADFVDYRNGFLIVSAPLEEHEAAALLKAKAKQDLGLSIGGFALERDQQESRVITKYRMVEFSDLPLSKAANQFTNIKTLAKEVKMDEKRDYLVDLVGKDFAEDFLATTQSKQKELDKAEVTSKEAEAKPPETQEVAETETAKKPEIPEEVLKEFSEYVGKEYGMQELSETIADLIETKEKVSVLEGLIKHLLKKTEEDDDEKLAKAIRPDAERTLSWMKENRASHSKETLVKEGDEIVTKEPDPDMWLADLYDVEPLPADAVKEAFQ